MDRTDAWPAWATEPVHLVDHDPAWATRADRFARELHEIFGSWLVGDIEHVGSTSVPDLPAKPIIDLQAVSEYPTSAVGAVGDRVAAAGWRFVPRELDDHPWRWFLVRVDDAERSRLAHLHLMPPGEDRWRDQLLFRDRLRADPQLRAGYAAVKRRAATDHEHDREAYTEAKTEFVRGAVGAG